jgi:tetratricopeptide (TPR) repeat protein
MCAVPFVLLVLLEFALRIAGAGEDLRLFVSTPDEASPTYGINVRVAQRYFSYLGEGFDPYPIKDLFLKKKPGNGYRIFVLGESTTAGFPYANNVSFARFLHRRLANAFPDRYIEVVNTSLTSLNSYTLMDFTDEILDSEPDALLIYVGHNEYYGAFGLASKASLGNRRWAVKLLFLLQRSRTFLLLRNAVLSVVRGGLFGGGAAEPMKPSDPAFIDKVTIPYGSSKYTHGLDQYRENLEDIIRKARNKGVPVLLCEVVSNLCDQAPFPSIANTLRPADIAFREARKLEAEGLYSQAREAYYRAKDLDPIRFRAPEGFNEILHQLGERYDVPVVALKTAFENASPHGLIGDNLMVDYIHPGFEGYSLMAEAFYRTMQEEQMIGPQWPGDAASAFADDRRTWGYTPLDSIHASLILINLKSGWPLNTKKFSTISVKEGIAGFRPKSRLDSLALATILRPNYSLLQAHLDLAKLYEREGAFDKAFAEYKSVIYTVPGVDFSYQEAVAFLFRIKDHERARTLLEDALKYNPSAYVWKWLGTANLMLGRIREGIIALRRAYEMDPTDTQIMTNLTRAYYLILEFESGDALLAAYQRFAPGDRNIGNLQRYRDHVKGRMPIVQALLSKARSGMKVPKPDQAVLDLQRAIEVHETALADEMMGLIMMKTGKPVEAAKYFEKAWQLSTKGNPELLNHLTTFNRMFPDSPEAKQLESLMKSGH